MIEDPDYIFHKSHSIIDMSDITITMDYMCRHCNKKDEELEEPCELNPYWMVTI
jgi:hypothetical protein